MNTKKLLFGSLTLGVDLAATRFLFTRPASSRHVCNSAFYKSIDGYVEEQMRRLKIPGVSLAIVEGNQIVHLRGFGCARPGGETPAPHTPFFIGSVTKSFTALAIMQLVEAGKVGLDTSVQSYLPWFRVADPEASTQITVRHLLNHTSGMSVLQGQMILSELEDTSVAMERQVRTLSSLELSHPVGSKFQYNNTNYNILGWIIEAASGESYPDYIQKHIFNPLDMRHSSTSKAEAQKNGLAIGHRYWFGYPIPAPNLPIPLGSLPSGQLISCAEDMAHYLIAHLNGGRYRDVQILSEAGIAELHRGAVEWREMGIDFGYYAMGWISQVYGKSTIVSHSGTVPDFGAFAALVPNQKKGIVLLSNANHGMIKVTLDEFGLGAAQLLAGERSEGTIFGALYLGMRAMLLIPILQTVSVITTLRLIRRWRADSELRPSRGRMWGQHILLTLFPDLLTSLTLVPMMSKMRGWIRLFMPDFSWIAWICGSFATFWIFLRTGLMLKALCKYSASRSQNEDTNP
jgi:CubicO group peptidase (beta-lactamase class C family)